MGRTIRNINNARERLADVECDHCGKWLKDVAIAFRSVSCYWCGRRTIVR